MAELTQAAKEMNARKEMASGSLEVMIDYCKKYDTEVSYSIKTGEDEYGQPVNQNLTIDKNGCKLDGKEISLEDARKAVMKDAKEFSEKVLEGKDKLLAKGGKIAKRAGVLKKMGEDIYKKDKGLNDMIDHSINAR